MAKKLNALDALLSAELETTKPVHIKRLGVDFTVKAITSGEFDQINEQSKGADGKTNEMQLNYAIIATACVDPSFKDEALRSKYGVASGADVVAKALLAGEVATLVKAILEISGFDNDIEQVKN